MTPCINLYPTTACDAKNDNRKQNTIASYAMKKFGIEYQGFLLRFCTHRNYFNWVFRSTKLCKYAIRSLIWSYVPHDTPRYLKYSRTPRRQSNIPLFDQVYYIFVNLNVYFQLMYHKIKRERSGSVVECLTRDRRVAGSSLTGVTALWSLSKTHLS